MNKSTLALDASHLLDPPPALPFTPPTSLFPPLYSFLILCSACLGQDPHLLHHLGQRLLPPPLCPLPFWLPPSPSSPSIC